MNIGEERETIITEPLEDPFKTPAPAPVETPAREKEKVPA